MRVVTLLIALALTLVTTPQAGAFIADLSVEVEPAQPTLLDPFVVTVDLLATSASLGEVQVNGSTLSIQIIDHAGCVILCPPFPFTFEVPFEPMPAGSYTIEILNQGMEVVGTFPLDIVGPEEHLLNTAVKVYPSDLTTNDRAQMLIAMSVPDCGYLGPELVSVERVGNSFEVQLQSVIEGDACPLVVNQTQEVLVYDLGQLNAGAYEIAVYLTEFSEVPPPGPSLVAYREFEVVDGFDYVLLQERFRVSAEWRDFEGNTGIARPVPGASEESTLFTFFGPDNWELMVKVLDGCAINDRFWVLGAAATNVEYSLTITDTQSGETWSYNNSLGELSQAFADTDAFASCSP